MPDFLESAKLSSTKNKPFLKKASQLGLPVSTITSCQF